jgi:Rieske 2Fe-2S family protein
MPATAGLPFTATELDATLLGAGHGRMLPRAAYTSERVLAFELERLFAGSWLCVGRAEDLAEPGSRRAVDAGGVGVLLVRGADGEPRAFANVCRHRAHELLAPGTAGHGGAIVCPYHGWSYRLDGSLHAAPGLSAGLVPGFLPAEHGLVRLPLEVWHGSSWSMARATASRWPSTSARSMNWWRRTTRSVWWPWRAVSTGWSPTGRSSARTTTSATTAHGSTRSSAR